MRKSDLHKIVREEIASALQEDSISEKDLTTNVQAIIAGMKDNKAIKSIVKSSYLPNGAVTFVVGADGKQYEIVVRPMRHAQFKELVYENDLLESTKD